MNVLVTGGAGYIGSVMTDVLLQNGHRVVVFDNLSRGHRDAVPAGASFVEADLQDRDRVMATLNGERIEAVIHMAGDALVGESMENPGKYYRTNVIAGLTLLEAMQATGVRTLVFSSTCAVYGVPGKVPMDETMETRPVNPYGDSKLTFERALGWFHAAHGFRVVSLRYFNAAGASEPVRRAARAGNASHPAGARRGGRHAGPCDDFRRRLSHARRHLRARLHPRAGSGRRPPAGVGIPRKGEPRHGIFNLGCGGEGHSIREVIDCARRVTGREIPAHVGPRRPGDPPVLVASSERAARELGWRPTRERLETIMESAWNWMRERG